MQTPLAASADLTAFGRDLGSGTAFPTTGPSASALRRGDVFLRTDLGTAGSMWQYAGAGLGASGWIARAPIVCTAATRPAVTYPGLQIVETDTGVSQQWIGTAWSVLAGGGDCFYKPTDGAAIALASGANLAIPFLQAINTHPDITRSPDGTVFTLNRAGVWTLSGGYRAAAVATAGTRYVLNLGDASNNPFNQMDTTSAGNPLDIAGSVTRRFPAGQTVMVVAFTNGAATTIDTSAGAAGGNARNFFSAAFLHS